MNQPLVHGAELGRRSVIEPAAGAPCTADAIASGAGIQLLTDAGDKLGAVHGLRNGGQDERSIGDGRGDSDVAVWTGGKHTLEFTTWIHPGPNFATTTPGWCTLGGSGRTCPGGSHLVYGSGPIGAHCSYELGPIWTGCSQVGKRASCRVINGFSGLAGVRKGRIKVLQTFNQQRRINSLDSLTSVQAHSRPTREKMYDQELAAAQKRIAELEDQVERLGNFASDTNATYEKEQEWRLEAEAEVARLRADAGWGDPPEQWARGYEAAVEKIATTAACVYQLDIEVAIGDCEQTVINLLRTYTAQEPKR